MSKKKTILIVEDEVFLSDIYKYQLEARGCLVHVVGNGQDALTLLPTVKPDVILLDLIMPNMNGFEFLEVLRADKKLHHHRVIVLTNLGQEEDKKRIDLFGIKDYLVKTQVGVEEVITLILTE